MEWPGGIEEHLALFSLCTNPEAYAVRTLKKCHRSVLDTPKVVHFCESNRGAATIMERSNTA